MIIRRLLCFCGLMATSLLSAQVLSVPSQFGTIAAAIAAAAPGQIVEIAPGTYFEHDLDFLGKSIQVRGIGGAAGVVIDAQSLGRGFQFRAGEGPSSILEGVTIRNGRASDSVGPSFSPHGGGILCLNSAPIIRDCTFLNCRAQDQDDTHNAGSGGGIAVIGSAARIEGCRIESCIAGETTEDYSGGFPYGDGSGIYVAANNVVVTRTVVRLCPYAFGGPNLDSGLGLPTTNGAGVHVIGSGFVMEDCTIEENGILGSGFSTFYLRGHGAGLYMTGNGQIRGTRFSGNRAALSGDGGGAYVTPSSGLVLFEGCTFEGNKAHRAFGDFDEGYDGGDGGGLFVSNLAGGGSIAIRDCDFIDNQSGDGESATGPVDEYGAGHGGGAFIQPLASGTEIARCRFVGNRAGDGTPGVASSNLYVFVSRGGYGGALFMTPGPALIEHCEFFANRAGHGAMSTIPSEGTSLAGRGGAIYCGPTAQIRFCTFADNMSGSSGGVVQPHSSISTSFGSPAPGSNLVVGSIFRGTVPSHAPTTVSIVHSNVEGGFFGTGNIDSDPKFVDRSRGNLHLAAGSPMIGIVPSSFAGTFVGDIDGDALVPNASQDMGADRFVRMGTADDFVMTTKINDRGRGTAARIAPPVGATLSLNVASPGGSFDGSSFAVVAETFATAAPITPDPSIPYLHLQGIGVIILVVEPILPPGGITYVNTVPPGLLGFQTRVQAFVIGPTTANGLIASTAAHDIVWP